MKYYSLYPENDDSQGVAYAPEGITFKLLYRKGKVTHWDNIEFTLRDGSFTDYQWNNLGWHMCSEKLKRVLTECVGSDDVIQWLPVIVKDALGVRLDYSILHLPTPCDVLSRTRTIMSGDLVVKPVLDVSKVGSHAIFSYSADSSTVYISEGTRKRIQFAGVTGLAFLKVPAVVSE